VRHKTSIYIFFLFAVLLLSSCTTVQETALPEDPGAKVTAAVQTVYAQVALTSSAEAAMATATPTITPEPTFTATLPLPTETPTNVFVTTLTAEAQAGEQAAADAPPSTQPVQPTAVVQQPAQQSGDMPCLRANLEYETIPDKTEMAIGRTFTKLWRIKNTGSCTWTENFAIRFVDGELMGAGATIKLTDVDIPTYGYAMIEVQFTAPDELGTFRSNWMIVSDDARLFGLGPNSKGWFWVEITTFNPN
jgi:hypothetical protein